MTSEWQYSLIDNTFSERKVVDAVTDLFAEDGRVYIVAGYFSLRGYDELRSSIEHFLSREEENQVTLIVGTEPDQFAARIAYDLWQLNSESKGKAEILKYEGQFLHTKHYVRDNESPAVVMGSANFTKQGLEEHLELVSYYRTTDAEDPIAVQHVQWFDSVIDASTPVTEEDLEVYEREKISVERLVESDSLTELGLSMEDILPNLEEPDSFPEYRINLLSKYLELEDTSRSTLAVKSKIKKYPHQIIAGSRAYRNLSYHGFYLLADEVGLGKTFEAGLALKQLRFAGKVDRALILCNSSAMKDWEGALDKFYENATLVTSSRKQDWKTAGYTETGIWNDVDDLLICTSQMFRQAVDEGYTSHEDWDMLILDEAHVVKNHESKIHQIVKNFEVPYKLFLTATPVQNSQKEFYNLFDALEEGFLGDSYESFKQRGENHLRDMLQGSKESFLTRHLRKDLPYMEIPPREVRDRFIPLSAAESEANAQFLEFLSTLIDDNEHSASHLVAVTYQKIAASSWTALEASLKKLRARKTADDTSEMTLSDFERAIDDEGQTQLTDDGEDEIYVDLKSLSRLIDTLESLERESKIEEAVDAIDELIRNEGKVVLFSQYKRNVLPERQLPQEISRPNLYERLKQELDVPVYSYHGSLTTTERYDMREAFEEDGGIFLTTEAGAESINLQHCNVLINFDIPWNPARLEQRNGRIQRLGQESEPIIFNLVIKDTIDESVYQKVINKHQLLQNQFGSSEEVTEQEVLEAVEAGNISELNSTSTIFVDAISERRSSEEIKEYFERELDRRDENLQELSKRMEENLEEFDQRLAALFSGPAIDTDKVEREIAEITEEYQSLLREYLSYIRFVLGIAIEYHHEETEIVLHGDEALLGEPKVRAAIDGETALFKDIPLLTPQKDPLKGLIEETSTGFLLSSAIADSSGFVFDFLITVESPLDKTQYIVRVSTGDQTEKVSQNYLKSATGSDGVESIDRETFFNGLREAKEVADAEAESMLSEQSEELEDYIVSEVARLRKREAEEIQNRVQTEVRKPISLQQDKVEKLKKELREGKVTGKKVEEAKQQLRERKALRAENQAEIRSEVSEKYDEKIGDVRRQINECTYNVSLVSACRTTDVNR